MYQFDDHEEFFFSRLSAIQKEYKGSLCFVFNDETANPEFIF